MPPIKSILQTLTEGGAARQLRHYSDVAIILLAVENENADLHGIS